MDYIADWNDLQQMVDKELAKQKMEKNIRISHKYFLTGLGLISLVAYTLLLCAISFIRGYSLSFWQFPLACVMMLVTQFFASGYLLENKIKGLFFKTSGILLAICFISILFANVFYDVSFDGQWYHQETIYQLKKGLNPYLKVLPAPSSEPVAVTKDVWCSGPDKTTEDTVAHMPTMDLKYLNINHLAKGTEIVEAAIYRFTNRIETGKAVNLIVLAASFFLCLSLLYRIDRFSTAKKWLIATIAAFNPIAITQLTSFCVDGVMASVFLCLFLIFCFLVLENNKYYLFLLGLLIMIGVNIKYTSLVYTAIFCSGFLLVLFIKKKWASAKKPFFTCAVSAVIGVCFIGFHPYITNLISTNQVFYGLTETRDEIYDITPPLLKNKNRFEKLFLSLATHADDQAASKESVKEVLKIPFALNKKDLLNANNAELKLSGFGPFFSGALLISIVMLLLAIWRFGRKPAFNNGVTALALILLSVLIIPDPWWARFVPQFWLLPVIILFMCEFIPVSGEKILRPLLYTSLGLNIIWGLTGIFFNLMITAHIHYQLAQLKTVSGPVSVEYCAYRPFNSNRVRFYENGIPFTEKKLKGNYIYNVIHSNTRFETREELPDLPKPFLMRLNEKFRGKEAD